MTSNDASSEEDGWIAEESDDSSRAPLEPGLYLVATPIGNLQDITLRALHVLKGVDRIACEDTRQTQKLLNYFGIPTPTISCHEHNEQARIRELIDLLVKGGRVAIVTDAGMPGISDPGMQLARAAHDAGIKVIPLPGANAALTALVASGLDTEQFLFSGFLPAKPGERRAALEKIAESLTGFDVLTVAFYEAPHRILDTLTDLESVWGGSTRVAIGRELTKRHEEMLRGTITEVRSELARRERIRGEIVLLVETRRSQAQGSPQADVADRVAGLMQSEGLDEKTALKLIARERGLSKSEVYRELQAGKAAKKRSTAKAASGKQDS